MTQQTQLTRGRLLLGLMLMAISLFSSCGPTDVARLPTKKSKPQVVSRVPVTSTHLQSVGYDKVSQTLTIEFRSGEVYEYQGVPPDIHAELMSAESHGRYFHRQIRDAGFAAHRVR
jgi:hypothetical protein